MSDQILAKQLRVGDVLLPDNETVVAIEPTHDGFNLKVLPPGRTRPAVWWVARNHPFRVRD